MGRAALKEYSSIKRLISVSNITPSAYFISESVSGMDKSSRAATGIRI